MGRSSLPAMTDPEGRQVGATFLRNNLSKRSICVDLKSDDGRALVLELAPRFDVVAENFKAGGLARLGLGYNSGVTAVHPAVIYLSVSGFGNTTDSPYKDRPAFAAIVEAMSGIYDYQAHDDRPPQASPVGLSATSPPPCSVPSASSPRSASETAPATASTSTSPCSTHWSP